MYGASSQDPGAVLALLNFILLCGQHACQEILYPTEANCARSVELLKRRHHLLKSCLSVAFPCLLVIRKESDLKKKHRGVHKEKDTNLYFSLPASRKENFFYNLHEGFF